ncbi:thiamine-phosphate kinase [Cyclobacterium marinum]|uniref:Thiamine-monophosphate kinase n=1 Tax=Cyclobacterium marinum (strain ATCC 25205 / DSM 745 / LMG 13164 / NCIMB 1802) TaxID=880070 RepID=G0J020_CYCMS|nr:thiamine-phosphate kinase [Cyclobacterium marinum]AEL26522.1 thiamine-monophosphate kinase [Cyclobacterium marinum DSM 745]MBI0399854.1 thiamine-phosphate kinase [Cyclobacterium marinum]MBR9777141.1 thiamine-phosphate kinase [Cytophagales bacterium]|tara:strand:- start:34815 stop:35846 length:1032 start_codon:yes stop_codon:yes gene_type:complete
MDKEKRTEISNLGEFGLIDMISEDIKTNHSSSIKGIGDDAAVIGEGDDLRVVTTDLLLEGVHFDLSFTPLKHLGFKAVAVNVSDVAAMNAIPTQVTVGIGLSSRFSVEAVKELYEGIKLAATHYNVDIVGGDTTSSRAGLVISITAIGEVKKSAISYRSGAKVNDIICATGDLGAAFIGLQILEREKQVFLSNPNMQPDLEKYPYITGRQLKPDARMDIIHEFKEMGLVPTSMIDVSDGLASELFHICKASDVGVAIYEDKLPIDKQTFDTAVELNLDPITCVLNGGEDYELLFTINQDDFKKLEKHPDIHFIGHVTEKDSGKYLVTKSGTAVELKAQGWVHF